MTRRRALLTTGLLCTAALLYIPLIISTLDRAKQIRAHPRRDAVLELMKGDFPHKLLARYVLLKPGHPTFHDTMRPWIYSHLNPLSDTPWNQYLLESDFLGLSEAQMLRFAPEYPLSPSSSLVSALAPLLHQGAYEVLPVLDRSHRGRAHYPAFFKKLQASPQGTLDVGSLIKHSVHLKQTSFNQILRHIPIIQVEKLCQALADVDYSNIPISNADTVLQFLRDQFRANNLRNSQLLPVLPGLLLLPDTSREAAYLLYEVTGGGSTGSSAPYGFSEFCKANDTGSSAEECFLDVALAGQERIRLLKGLFRAALQDETLAADVFHTIAHTDTIAAQEIALDVLNGPDSPLRKAVIVLAVRHDFGYEFLDQAFTGSAPREVIFKSFSQYVDGSKTARRYSQLSGHQFFKVGKRWPPYYGSTIPKPEDPTLWREFIDEHPWFPAIDDAYYRLAYAQLMNRDLHSVLATITEYSERHLLDNDSDSFIRHLQLVARTESGDTISIEELQDSLESIDVPWYVKRAASVRLDRTADAVDWLLRNRPLLKGEIPAIEDLSRMRQEIEDARGRCAESRQEDCELPISSRSLKAVNITVPPALRASALAFFSETFEVVK